MFLILWAEPAGESGQSGVTNPTVASNIAYSSGLFGEPVFQKVRRFVVLRLGSKHCTALYVFRPQKENLESCRADEDRPVTTYTQQGVAKHGVTKSDHAIIYTGKEAPRPMQNELPVRGEYGMRSVAIRVDPDVREEKLDSMSRIDFGKPHTINHNLKVRSFGQVNNKSMPQLLYQFQLVWSNELKAAAQQPDPRTGPVASSSRSGHMIRENQTQTVHGSARQPDDEEDNNDSNSEEDDSTSEEEDEAD